jgi:hypothetical protein
VNGSVESYLLKGKRVFVDTTEFSEANFNVKNPSFAEFQKLCEKGRLTLITTEITRREIFAGVKIQAEKSKNAIDDVCRLGKTLAKVDAEALRPLLEKVKTDVAEEAVRTAVEEFFAKCSAITAPIPATAVEEVIGLYFDRQPPFGGGKKKAEFPDAFVLEALKRISRPHDAINVVSKDKDFEKACAAVPDLVWKDSLARLLSCVNTHDVKTKQVNDTVRANIQRIKKELQQILSSLPGELEDCQGAVELTTVKLDDILDELVVSVNKTMAAVDFVVHVEVDAVLEFFGPASEIPEFRHVERFEDVNITLVFRFDPKDATSFEMLEYWAPSALRFR